MTATEFKRTETDMLDYLDNAAIGLHWVDGNPLCQPGLRHPPPDN